MIFNKYILGIFCVENPIYFSSSFKLTIYYILLCYSQKSMKDITVNQNGHGNGEKTNNYGYGWGGGGDVGVVCAGTIINGACVPN